MSNLKRDIGSEDLKIGDLVKLLREDKFLVPTFQRDFVWDPASILKLWDSMYRFYPIGSILYWETDSYLHTHRKLGGFEFPHDEDTVRKFKEWKYILDGQQRATSILVCMLGGKGKVQDNEEFDYTLHFDSALGEFFFANQFETRCANVPDPRLLPRVRDIPEWNLKFYKEISAIEGINENIENNLQQVQRMFTDYKLSVIHVRGVEVAEVCEIFERINQEGKRLHPVDIIVARTYRTEQPARGVSGFYLRENLRCLTDKLAQTGSRWQEIDDLLVIQMLAVCLRKQYKEGRSPFGITPASLDNLETEHFEKNWEACKRAIFETVKFFMDQRILGPGLLPFSYLALPLCSYFFKNNKPNRDLARQWMWRTAFALDSFNNSSEVYGYCEFFQKAEDGAPVTIPPLTITPHKLITSSYYYRNAFSRAVLAFFANQRPIDFSDPHAEVLDNVYLLMTQAPNLHHIYPQNFLKDYQLPLLIETNSLMNIVYLRARTNIQISDENPLAYFKDFQHVRELDSILESHMIPREFLERDSFSADDYKEFLYARASLVADRLKKTLPDVEVKMSV